MTEHLSAYVLNYYLDRMKSSPDMTPADKLNKAFFMVCTVREVAKSKSGIDEQVQMS
jgi:hypothetical protein